MPSSALGTFGRWRSASAGASSERAVATGAGAIPDPVGYSVQAGRPAEAQADDAAVTKRRAADAQLKQKRAWDIATGQTKQVGMTCFMMYMSGSGVQIFSILVTCNGILQPLRAILASGKPFEPLSDASGKVDVTGPRLLFCAIQAAGLAFAVYRLNVMGLLPTTVSDWVSGLPPPAATEFAAT